MSDRDEQTETEQSAALGAPEHGDLAFADLQLAPGVEQAVKKAGYDKPTTIQAQIIPHMLAGRDVLAQSQTGTGKTAAFALPILSRLDVNQRRPQVLVLAPTRELAIQVSRSFSTYGACLPDFSVATIYGGQSYEPQLKQLRRGAQVVVGTPGRVIDHIKRGTLDIGGISCLVLDEADEMLNMGFLDDVKFVLSKSADGRQIALFSATIPGPIQSIAEQYLNDPAKITGKKKEVTADSIRQRAIFVSMRDRVRALCRILDAEDTDGVIVFTKTRASTTTVAESLGKEGLKSVALNGDMPQATRERTVERFKAGYLDVLVATDVAARGLDVSRVSHVFNFDMPHDTESYIHRIGRTGRAGRTGEAITLLPHSQRAKLRLIERATKRTIEVAQLPSADEVNGKRVKQFRQQITDVAGSQDLTMFTELIKTHSEETGLPLEMVAAALAHISLQGRQFLTKDRPPRKELDRNDARPNRKHTRFDDAETSGSGERRSRDAQRKTRQLGPPRPGMERFRISVGRKQGVRPGNIVGAVANEGGIDGENIGPIQIFETYSTIDLPEGLPSDVYATLQAAWVGGKQLNLTREKAGADRGEATTGNRKPNQGGANSKPSNNSGRVRKPFAKSKGKAGGKRNKKRNASAT